MENLKTKINADLKTAMLTGDRERADILRGLKSAILNEEIATKQRESGLGDEAIEKVVAREIKKRDEAAELYEKGGNATAADKERAETEVIKVYLPQQLSDEELVEIAEGAVAEAGDGAHMGKVIGAVKAKVGNRADGARVAAAVQKAMK